MNEQLALEDEGHPATLSPGHAAVRFSNPTNGRDVLPTIRTEMHRIRGGSTSVVRREVGSSVYQVFDGGGTVTIGERQWRVARGDLFVVPSWQPFSAQADAAGAATLDLFRFSDAPIFEALARPSRADRRRLKAVRRLQPIDAGSITQCACSASASGG